MKQLHTIILVLILGCTSSQKPEIDRLVRPLPDAFTRILDAHGGLPRWDSLRTLTYSVDGEQHTIDLPTRMTRIESASRSFGFDGNQVWVAPDSMAEGNEAFMYNLNFYFLAMPFVLADPGVKYEAQEQKVLNGVSYNALMASFQDSVGISTKDRYLVLSNPETNHLEWLMYSATFGASETSEDFSLIRYGEWKETGGIWLATSLQWTGYEGDSTLEVQGEAKFENVLLSTEALPKEVYRKLEIK